MNERVTRIVRNYEERMRLDWEGRLTEAQIKSRVERYAVAAEAEDVTLGRTRLVLAVQDVPQIVRCYYHSYARELGRLRRRGFGPATEQVEAWIIISKWMARGLTQSVLRAIAEEAFALRMAVEPGGEEVASA